MLDKICQRTPQLEGHISAIYEVQACKDDPNFKDEGGYGCDTWIGYSCRAAKRDHGYSKASQDAILRNCPAACQVCIPAAAELQACVDDKYFVDEGGYRCH